MAIARPTDASALTVSPLVPIPFERSRQADGVVLGSVAIALPGGVREGVPATVRWVVTEGALPDEASLASAPTMSLPDDGSFVIELTAQGTLFCLAEHVDGVTSFSKAPLPTDQVTIDMAPAGKLWVRLAGNDEGFTLLLEPRDHSLGEGGRPHAVMRVQGNGDSLAVGGIPLEWSAVRVSILWSNGARTEVASPVPLTFRSWSQVLIDRSARLSGVRGSVVDSSGVAIADALVHCFYTDNGRETAIEYRDVESRRDGTFELDGLRSGEATLVVSKPGFVGHRRDIHLIVDQFVNVGPCVLDKGATVRGRLDPAVKEPNEYRVAIRPCGLKSDHAMMSARHATPADDGWFEFRGIEPGEWVVALLNKQPGIWSPWSGRVIVVSVDDREVVVPDIEPAQLTMAALQVRSQGTGSTKGLRAIARGVDGEWVTYGEVGKDETVDLPRGRGRFLFGVSDSRDGQGPSLSWCGVLPEGASYVEVPAGRVVLTRVGATDTGKSLLTVEYSGGESWPATVLPLASETTTIAPGTGDVSIEHLAPGSYTIRVVRGREERRVPVQVDRDGHEVRLPWPY